MIVSEEYDLLKAMVEFSPDMLCAVDYNGCLRQVSPASQALLHYDSRDLLGRYLGDIIHPDDRAAALAQCAEARRAPGAVSFESRCLAATGQVVRIAWSVHWVAAEELLIGVGRRAQVAAGRPAAEATAVAAQRVMRQQAEQLTNILESINDAFISLDRAWNLTYINGPGEQLLNVSQEGALGLNLWSLFPEAQEPCEQYRQALSRGETVRFNFYARPLRCWYEVRAYPFSDGISVFLIDITKRVEDEKQLKLLALVARNTDNGVLITDAEGRTEWVNDAFVKHTGYTLADMLGRTPGSVLHGPETDPATCRFIQERLRLGTGFSATILTYRKSGKKVWLAIEATPVRDEAGQLTQYVAVLQNITFRKEVEASQANMTQDLYRHNRDLQQFTYVISHNLRAPLANALGLSVLLTQTDRHSAVFDTALASLRQSMLQADDVLKDLNQVLSIRDRKDVLAQEPLVFREVCLQAVQNLQEPLHACAGKVALTIDPELAMRGNRAYLYSIFYNLLSNSIKYRSEERALRIDIACGMGEHGGPTITFTDNGSGFDMFKAGSDVFQLYKRFHTNQRGRGIGLFLVKTHVEALGGKITVASEVNFGTRFTIHLNQH